MDIINNYSFHDSSINEILIRNGVVYAIIRLWNGKLLRLIFKECRMVNYAFSSQDISDLIINIKSPLLEKAVNKAIADGDAEDEVKRFISYTFIDSWDQEPMIELIACEIDIEEIS